MVESDDNFSRRLAAVILTYGIKLMDIQEQCGIYLNWHFMITDYVDHKFITSIDHAKKLLTDIENNKRKEIGENYSNLMKNLMHGIIPVV